MSRQPLAMQRPASGGLRRTRLTVRRLDPVSVLKFSAILYVCLFAILLVAGVVLWMVFSASGLRANVEDFISELVTAELSDEGFRFEAGQMFKAAFLGGLILVIGGTVANVVMALIFNLISDLIGGVTIGVETHGLGVPAPVPGTSQATVPTRGPPPAANGPSRVTGRTRSARP